MKIEPTPDVPRRTGDDTAIGSGLREWLQVEFQRIDSIFGPAIQHCDDQDPDDVER